MRGCCLFFALLILAGGILLIFFTSIISISFNWQDWLVYFVIAIVIYLIILAIGNSLNTQFNKLIDDFITDRRDELVKKGPFSIFGFLLIILLPYLIYLLLFSFYSVITLGVYGFWLMSYAERIPVVFPLALIVIVCGTTIAIIIGLYYLFYPPKRKPIGLELTKTDEPKLWKLVQEVADDVGSKPVDKITASPFAGVGVYLNGSFLSTLFGGGSRVLEIGFPSIYKLKIGEFKAILAHEYGHFSNKDTQWGSFTYSMGNSLTSTLKATPGPSGGDQEGTFANLIALNPAYWILYIFTQLFFKVTNGFSRVREVLADKKSCELYGGKAFGDGLKKIALNDGVFSEVIEKQYIPELMKNNQVFTSYSRAMSLAYSETNKNAMEDLEAKIMNFKGDEAYTTHPRIKTRILYASKFEDKGIKIDSEYIAELFENWEAKNEEITSIYNYILMARAGLLNSDGTIKKDQTEDKK